VDGDRNLPANAGPVPDRLTIWPVDDGRCGLDGRWTLRFGPLSAIEVAAALSAFVY
jgi:hypothetical protein